MSKMNLKPVETSKAIDVMNACWKKLFRAYSCYNNASTNNELHFSDKVWNELIGCEDDQGEWHKGVVDQLYDEYPYELTMNICIALLKELEARDKGFYRDIYENEPPFIGESPVLAKIKILEDMHREYPQNEEGFK